MRLRQDDEKRIDLIAFGAASPADVDALAVELVAKGVQMISEPEALDTPGGGYGFRFFDGEGRTVEVSADVANRDFRKIEERESIPVRLSHVVINSANPEATVAWYNRHLGFRLSDTLCLGGHGRHHVVPALQRLAPLLRRLPAPHARCHHVSFEMRGIDEYMRGTGRLLRAGVEKVWGPGRHKAGNNTFTYFLDKPGNTVEYTTELESVDEDDQHPSLFDVTEPDVTDQWGTANPMNEFVAAQMFNDPDRGLFVAPPL